MQIKTTSLRVRQSMLSMLLGRPVSAIGGLLVLTLLSRNLATKDYGGYFAVLAVVEIAMLATNFGLLHAVYRYVSANESMDGALRPIGPVWQFICLRFVSLLIPVAVLILLSPAWAKLVGLPITGVNTLWLIAVIVLSEGMARFLEAVFDSMLCQGRSQLTLTLRTILRLLGVGILMGMEQIGLTEVLLVEALATTLGALIGLALLGQLWRTAQHGSNPAEDHPSFVRMARFALPGFCAQILAILYSPDALKLALGGAAGSASLAVFGFAYALAAVVQRYMPAHLLAGIFRPVFVSASSKPDAEKLLSGLVGLTIKINWLLILPIAVAAYFGGDALLSLISKNTYANAGSVAFFILLGFLAVAIRLTLSMYCLATEDSRSPLIATAVSVVGLPFGIYMAGQCGALGVALALGAGEIVWSITCYWILRVLRGELKGIDYSGLLKMAGAGVLAIIAGYLLGLIDGCGWHIQSASAAVLVLALCVVLRPLNTQETQWLHSVFPVLGRISKGGM